MIAVLRTKAESHFGGRLESFFRLRSSGDFRAAMRKNFGRAEKDKKAITRDCGTQIRLTDSGEVPSR